MIHLLNGDLTSASTALENARTLEPGSSRPLFLLALVRLGQGRSADARALLLRVPPADPNYRAAREKLAALDR